MVSRRQLFGWTWACFASTLAGQGIITTIAGSAAGSGFVFPQTPITGTAAPTGAITGVVLDGKGNLYVSDASNSLVFKLDTNGILTIVAGNRTAGFSGDNGPATSSALSSPQGLAVDGAGNLLIADTGNNRIRRVTPGGTISTIAGNGGASFAGDNGPATAASLAAPDAVAADSAGNVYIADTGNNRVRTVSPLAVITTFAGNGQPLLATSADDGIPAIQSPVYAPTGVAVDADGNVYIAGDWPIRKVTAAGVITSIALGGPAITFPDASQPSCSSISSGIGITPTGMLLVTDYCPHVFAVGPSGNATLVAGTGVLGFSGDGGPALIAELSKPQAATGDAAGNIFIADTGNDRVRYINPAGTINTIVGNGNYSNNGGSALSASLSFPRGVAIGALSDLYIADTLSNRIRHVTPDGTIATIAGNGGDGFSGDGGLATSATLGNPFGVAVDSKGDVFIADTQNTRTREVNPSGIINTVFGGANGVAVDSGNDVFATDAHHVYEMTPAGASLDVVGGGPDLQQGDLGDG